MYIFIKRILDKFQTFKGKLKRTNFYYVLRDYIFKREAKKEKKIENQGQNAIINYIKKWYKKQTGEILNLDCPKYLSEKQQWIKLYDQDKLKNLCSDKYLVRDYIKEKIGEEYLIPIIKIDGRDSFENADEINFGKLPNSFVIACNHGSSMTIVVKDKTKLSKKGIKQIKKKLNRWLTIEPAYINAFDFVYKDIKPRIYITEFINNKQNDLYDYKIMCFNGEPQFVWVDTGRFFNHKRTIYDLNFKKLNFKINNYESSNDLLKPDNFEEMLELSKILSSTFKFVRVDFYNVDGRIYFGELTFNSEAGVAKISPREVDIKIASRLKLGEKHNDQ